MVKNLPTVERSTKIRFGKNTLEDQAENTIVFNASNTKLQATRSGAVYLAPIRFREDFSDPEIVLLMYDKSTGEITESGSSASTAVEPPLSSVTGFGNTTPYTIEFNNPSTSFFALSNAEFSNTISIGSLTPHFMPIVGSDNMLEDSTIRLNNGSIVINSSLEVVGDITFSGNSYVIESQSLNIKDKIIGISNNNPSNNSDGGLIIENTGHNVGLIHHGDEDRFSMGYTQNVASDTHILHDSNVFLLDVLGNLQVQNNITVTETGTFDHLVAGSVTIKTNSFYVDPTTSNVGIGTNIPEFKLDVHGTSNVGTLTALSGAFTGPVSGTTGSFTSNVIGTSYTGGPISGTTGTFTSNVSGVAGTFTGDVSGVAGTFTSNVSGVAGIFTGDVSGVAGTFTGDVSGVAGTFASAQINGVVNTTGNLTVNTDAIFVDATNKKVGIGKTPTANLDVVGNINSSTGITSASGGITATTGLFTGDGGLISNVQVSSVTGDLALGTATSGDYVQSMSGGDGITVTSGSGESSTPSVAIDLKANGGLVIESTEVAVDLGASAITGTLAVADGGTGVTTSTGSSNVVLSDSPTLTGTLTAATSNFSGDLTVGSNKLFVDVSTSNVGIGTATPGYSLDVHGTANVGTLTATTGTFSGTLSSGAFTATTGQFNGTVASTNNLTVGGNKLFVDVSTSNVGIGTVTPAFNLDVHGTANTGAFTTTTATLTGDLSVGSNKLFVDVSASGVGIGTTSPAFNLDVHGTANVGAFTATTATLTDDLTVNTDTLVVDVSASSVGIRTTLPAFNLDVHGTANTGAFTTTTATLTDNLSVGSNKLFVDVSASSVGIGTTSPAFNLDVHGTSNTGTFTATTATLTGDLIVDTDTLVVDVSESSVGIGTTLPAFKLDVHGTANTGAFTTTTATLTGDLIVDTDTLVVDVSASGVGIGTTLPAFKLDVHGTANVGAFTTTTATLTDNLIVDTDTLYVDTSVKCVGIETTTPHANLHVSGNVYVTEEITTSSNVNAVKVYSSEGMVINTGSVCKKFYGFDGTIANGATTTAAEIKLTFSSNIFYAKIVAHLVEDSTEFSNMSLEVGGGSRLGGTNPDLKLGSVSVFGNTSTNPWNSTPILGASTIIIKPSADINSGGGTSTDPALYNLFIEYITPDATNGVLSTIQLGTNIVKQFDY